MRPQMALSTRRVSVITRFEDFLASHPNRLLHLVEICLAIGVAERTLRDACEAHFGMGPKRYLTLRRMQLVRQALQHADPRTTNVTRIAIEHGFLELGRFSVAYRALFGESPSETLKLSKNASMSRMNACAAGAVT